MDTKAEESQFCFSNSKNMTEILHSLKLLVKTGNGTDALSYFYDKWSDNNILIDKWFSIQAIHTPYGEIFSKIEHLSMHTAFRWKNPNRLRSLIAAFAFNNPRCFHSKEGKGYQLVASWVRNIDPINPQMAARLCTAFETIDRLEPDRQDVMKSALKKIRFSDNISKDTLDISSRLLKLQ